MRCSYVKNCALLLKDQIKVLQSYRIFFYSPTLQHTISAPTNKALEKGDKKIVCIGRQVYLIYKCSYFFGPQTFFTGELLQAVCPQEPNVIFSSILVYLFYSMHVTEGRVGVEWKF